MTELLGEDLARAAQILRNGGLVALPSETVYGLAARGLDVDCARKIFAAKGRPSDNPLILHVGSFDDALPLWDDTPLALHRAQILAQAFWPGPLTIVCHKSELVPDAISAGLPRVAVRVPAHASFLAVLRLVGEPLAAPSANASGRPSPTTAQDVLQSLAGRIDAVVDGGPCRIGIESTVIDVSGPVPTILRPGATRLEKLRALLPDIVTRTAGQAAHVKDASPGLRHRHYAPAIASLLLVEDVAPHWASDAALLVRAASERRLGVRPAQLEVLPDDVDGYARALYAALYRLERAAPARLVIEAVPHEDAWLAVRDRLARAVA